MLSTISTGGMSDRKSKYVTPGVNESNKSSTSSEECRPQKRLRLGDESFWWDEANIHALQALHSADSYPASDVTCDHQDVTEALPDDLLSKCFFGGFLNSIDIIRSLSCVNKRLRKVAQLVKLLDLRSCKRLRPVDTSNLVNRFQKLSVSRA